MKRSLLLLVTLTLCAQAALAACVRAADPPDSDGSVAAQPTPWKTVTATRAQATGRADCPADWVAYADPRQRFSICYPANYSATASDDAVNIDNPRAPGQQTDLIGVAVGWEPTPGTAFYPPSAENCPLYLVMGQTSSEVVELTIDGRTAPACLNRGQLDETPPVPIAALQGALPLAADGSAGEGYVRFAVNVTGDVASVPEAARAIIETLSIDVP